MQHPCYFLAIAVAILPLECQAANLKLKVLPQPAATAIKVTTEFGDTMLAENAPLAGIVADVSLDGEPPGRSVFALWSDGAQTSFPMVLAATFENKTIEVHISRVDKNLDISRASVFDHCLSEKPASLTQAFDMYYWCKSAALEAESKDRKWDQPHLAALQGWLRANYYLFTRANPVSPYGIDADLVTRLDDVAAEEGKRKRGQDYWSPLRLDDVDLVRKFAQNENVRWVGLVPDLIKQGKLLEAGEINNQATSTLKETGDSGIFGVTTDLLKANEAYIQTLKANNQ